MFWTSRSNLVIPKEVITEMTTERNYFKKQLDTLYQSKAIGAQIRSKVEFMEEDERFTQYFLSVEKHRQDNNCIKALKDKDITYSDDKDLLCVASTFYNEFYTSEKPTVDDINTFLDRVNLPVLTIYVKVSSQSKNEKKPERRLSQISLQVMMVYPLNSIGCSGVILVPYWWMHIMKILKTKYYLSR